MNRIKKLIILSAVLLFSGCTVNYKLTINSDLSVNEQVVASELSNRLRVNTGLNEKEAVYYLYEMFNRKNLNTNMDYTTKNSKIVATVTGNHSSLDEYINNFTSDLVKEANLEKDGDTYTLTFDQTNKISKKEAKSLVYDGVNVTISVPFKVIENNADSVRKNDYTWNLKKDEDLRKISIKFDSKSIKDSQKFKIGDKVFNISNGIIALSIFVSIIIIIVTIVFVKNKKNNRI